MGVAEGRHDGRDVRCPRKRDVMAGPAVLLASGSAAKGEALEVARGVGRGSEGKGRNGRIRLSSHP